VQGRAVIDDLRKEIARIEGRATGGPSAETPALTSTGFAPVDAHLPGGGLLRAGLHEVIGVRGVGHVSATGFALHLMTRLAEQVADGQPDGQTDRRGVILWCRRTWQPDGELYAPGVETAGLKDVCSRLIMARCDSAEDVLWAMEEALSAGALAAVLGEPGNLPARSRAQAVRRLQLAAENHDVSALLLMDKNATTASPACSRWRIAPAPGGRWLIELLKYRNGRPARWSVPVPGLPGYLYDEQRTRTSPAPTPATENGSAVAAVSADGPGPKTNVA